MRCAVRERSRLFPIHAARPTTGPRSCAFYGPSTGIFRTDYLFTALALNLVYIGLGAAVFFIAFNNARRRGALLQMGE